MKQIAIGLVVSGVIIILIKGQFTNQDVLMNIGIIAMTLGLMLSYYVSLNNQEEESQKPIIGHYEQTDEEIWRS